MYAIVANRNLGLYQTSNLEFDAVSIPTWKHVGGNQDIFQVVFNRLNPFTLQCCIDSTQQTAYMRWPAGYGPGWTQILTAAQIQALIGDADYGKMTWIEYNAYMPGHVYIGWNYDITLGGIWFLRSTDYGATWQAVNLYAGITNYSLSCINASRIAGAGSAYANGGVIYLCIQYGIGAVPYVMCSVNDGLNWTTSNTTGTTAAAHLVYADPLSDTVSYTDLTFGAGNNDLGRNLVYGVGNYVEIDGASQCGIPSEAAIWINPQNSNRIRITYNNMLHSSDDCGATWSSSAPWVIGEVRALDGMRGSPVNLLIGKYAPGGPGTVFITTDDGATIVDKSGANAALPDGGGDSVPWVGGIAPQGVALGVGLSGSSYLGGNMTTMNEFFDADMGSIWVQPGGPNSPCYPVLCHSTDGFDEPSGDVTTRMCRGPSGWRVSHRSQGVPGEATIDIEAYLAKTRMWLQKQSEKRCPMPVYLHMSQCGASNIFLNYDYGELGRNALITNKSPAAHVRGKADAGDGAADATTATWTLSAEPITNKYWKLVETVRSVAEAEPLRDIAFCNEARCLGPCGAAEDICEDGTIVADATAAAVSDVWLTANGFTTGAAAAAAPYAVSIDIASTTCFYIDRDTQRRVVMRGTTEANANPIAYTDDGGATWNVVTGSGTTASFASHGGCLFSLDGQHIWHCSNLGTIFFSDDYGLTWTDQEAPLPAGGAETLYAIKFVDENYGVCVGGTAGASSVFLYTSDGGEHWNLGTGPAAELITGCAVLDGNRVWVTMHDGECYYSNDFGTNWTQRTFTTTPTALADVDFRSEFFGAICGNYNDGVSDYGVVYRTFNGGYDWEVYVAPTAFDTTLEYYGLNAVWICDDNQVYAVGEPVDSVGLIYELEAGGAV